MKTFKVLAAVVTVGTSLALFASSARANAGHFPYGWNGNPKGGSPGDGSPGNKPSAVPEIDPAGLASMGALVMGGLGLITARRRKSDDQK